MRNQCLGLLMVLCVTGLSSAAMVLDWSEDFSSNPVPAWTQTGNQIQWSSSNQNLSWQNYYNSSDSFSRPSSATMNQGSDFQVKLNYAPGYCWYATQHLGGLVNSDGNGKAIFGVVPRWTEYPSQFDVTGRIQDSDGEWYATPIITIGQYTNYTITMTYTGASRNLNLNITSGETVWGNVDVILPEGKTFSVDQVKLYNQAGGGGDFWATVDNVSLSIPEPATMSLLAVSTVTLLMRRNHS